ncbi:MAG: DUF4230 domain-containing protein [Muribaculum sp.]|nr:DUF4230 domain-containing protein [Muribaculum sp.]
MNETLAYTYHIHRLTYLITLLSIALTCNCSKQDDSHTELYQEIKSADKIVFASMAVTKTAKTERSDWYKIGKRIAVYSYDSYLQAYIDLTSLQTDDFVFDDKAKTVSVTLPPIEVEIAGRDIEMKKVYENISLFRSDIDAKERAEIKERANKSFMKEVKENPMFSKKLTESAERKARKYFEALFEANGYTATITFRNRPANGYLIEHN